MTDEPTVLDYVKSKLIPWKHNPVAYPAVESQEATTLAEPTSLQPELSPTASEQARALPLAAAWPWRPLLALALALIAQRSLEPGPNRTWTTGALFYLLSAALLIWTIWREEWSIAALPKDERSPEPLSIHVNALLFGIPLALAAYLAFGGNLFTPLNLILWYFAMVLFLRAFWLGDVDAGQWLHKLRGFFSRRKWNISISRWALLLLAVAAVAIFFRAYQLNLVPPEMNSDHAEKLLDVNDVLNGQTHIFFPRNTGREAIQFYLTAAIATILGTGVSFTSLKIGTLLGGLLTLPFIYLLGKEVGNRRIGLFAAAFAGIAYWPNVIARIALRFTFYPLFVAPALYFLIRGLRRANRNDFILSGIALGIGLHGYTPIRILPFVIIVAVGIYLIHRQSKGVRKDTLVHLGVLAVTSLVIFLPLLRYAQENPEMFSYRAMTRMGTLERPLPGPALQIFLKNLWNAITMFFWDNGDVWTHSVPHRPALGIVAAALFFLGIVLLLVRYLRQRHWLDLFLLVSIPLLMLPSILSLAFPNENPNLSRTGGALVPVFLIIGIALDGLYTSLKARFRSPWNTSAPAALIIFLFSWSAFQNYGLVFNQFYNEYRMNSWNSSEMGSVIREFADTIGSADNAWVVGYPYWVDTRLVGINAGYPTRDYVILQDQLDSTAEISGPKLFLINLQDQEAVIKLRNLYPQGVLEEYHSKTETKDFLMFFVPPQK